MDYVLINGVYQAVGHSPDGDSIKFQAANPLLWKRINTENREVFEQALTLNAGVVTLRLQGVDALETHYAPPKPPTPDDVKGRVSAVLTEPKAISYKQPTEIGRLAANQFLGMLGFTSVRWRNSPRGTYITEAIVSTTKALVKVQGQDNIPGFIVTGDVERNGRPISWVFPGTTALADGAIISTPQLAEMAEQSANYQLLRQGLIYPLYYMTLGGKLRQKLDKAVQEAQAAARATPTATTNLWAIDRSLNGLTLPSVSAIATEVLVYPELFRRLLRHAYRLDMLAYWDALRTNAPALPPSAGLALHRLFEGANPYVFVISDQDFLRLSDIIEISGNSLRMKKSPHDLVFLS